MRATSYSIYNVSGIILNNLYVWLHLIACIYNVTMYNLLIVLQMK